MHEGWVCWLGSVPYREAWELQKALHQARLEGQTPDTLLLLEHPPVITLGRGWKPQNLLFSEEEYARRGIEVCPTDRGGDVTYHAPGQLVGYPIFDLRAYGQDLHRYLRGVEEALILALHEFGLTAGRCKGYTGVWIGDEKIAAIGIKVTHWISLHGFALNVSTDLKPFGWIVPCGIQERGVTSLEKLLDEPVPMEKVIEAVIHGFEQVFELKLNRVAPSQLWAIAQKYPALRCAQGDTGACHAERSEASQANTLYTVKAKSRPFAVLRVTQAHVMLSGAKHLKQKD